MLFNVFVFSVFLLIFVTILVIKYKGKLTEEEKAAKEYKKKEYILSRIQNFQETNNRISQRLITGLPAW
jgi:hypothetical protein